VFDSVSFIKIDASQQCMFSKMKILSVYVFPRYLFGKVFIRSLVVLCLKLRFPLTLEFRIPYQQLTSLNNVYFRVWKFCLYFPLGICEVFINSKFRCSAF